METIIDSLKKYNLDRDNLFNYNDEFVKVLSHNKTLTKRKLVLVTATSPTPYGEGKTTISISLNDALNKLNYKSLLALREPSLGPVFGFKGGATGGGCATLKNSDQINLHFTGDIHGIGVCNNLISAAIDNHIYFGNKLKINNENIIFKRCIDVCDRSLRDNFNITAASEIMAIITLASDIEDLKKRLNNIIIAFDIDDKPVYLKELNMTGSLLALLKDVFNPNMVLTNENNIALIHGGPFANIAHGCSSVKATNIALDLADYTITEAGFGSDLGAVKFIDIKCRLNNIKPDAVVLTTTVKALLYNGENDISKGISNLEAHINILSKFGIKPIVCINKYANDLDSDINYIKDYLNNNNIKFAISTGYIDGSDGSIELAKLVIEDTNNFKTINQLYNVHDTIKTKISNLLTKLYDCNEIVYSEKALSKIKLLEINSLDKLPICIAKNQYSISNNKNLLGYPKNNKFEIRDIEINNGAGFITVYTGKIIKMPGLSKDSNYTKINLINNEIINIT